jgi:hypothetical protein
MHIRVRVRPACCAIAVALLVFAVSAGAQDKKAPKIDKAVLAEQAATVAMMDDAMAGKIAPTDFTFTWANHMMKSRDGKAFIPFILTFEKGKPLPANASYYVRVVSKSADPNIAKKVAEHKEALEKAANRARLEPENQEYADAEAKLRANPPKADFAFEDLRLAQTFVPAPNGAPFKFAAAVAVPAGDYDVYVLLKEPTNQKDKKAQPKAGLLKTTLTVPNLFTDELAMSTVFVTTQTEQLKAPPTQEEVNRNPYLFGMTRLNPVLEAMPKFAKKDELSILFYIYNTGLDKTTGKPDLSIEYNFYRKDAGVEKFFNKTNPQLLNAATLGPNFDTKLGHQLLGGQGIPLASFPEGEYRLEIKVIDKVTSKSKVENSVFTVIAG